MVTRRWRWPPFRLLVSISNRREWGPYLSVNGGRFAKIIRSPVKLGISFPTSMRAPECIGGGEDGLLGISDARQQLCFALALWNGVDPILKERLYGLTGSEGNHGEDVKEYYYYLDATPTHSYLKGLYKYPQRPFPMPTLPPPTGSVHATNRNMSWSTQECSLRTGTSMPSWSMPKSITGRHFDPDLGDELGSETARLDLLPTLWFRNT